MIKFKNQSEAASNEISFVPHFSERKDVIDRSKGNARSNNDDELTTVIIDTGSKFAYDTINNNEGFIFASNNTTNLESDKSNNQLPTETTITIKPTNEVVEVSSPELNANNVKENNEKQEAAVAFDISNNIIKSQMEGSKERIGNKAADVDIKSNSHGNRKISAKSENSENEISAVANSTSSEKNSNDFEIQRFISEHIKYKSNNVTIKKSWGKWSPWSSCSRSCNEGVMQQSRECMQKM